VPGNKMPFPGLKTEDDRADVIAYLAAGATGTRPAASAAQQPSPAAAAPTPQPAPTQAAQAAPVHDIT